MACARGGTTGEFTVAVTQYVCCGESRVDRRWEEVHSLEQLEQSGRNPAALPTLGPGQASLIDHSTLLTALDTDPGAGHYQLSSCALDEANRG